VWLDARAMAWVMAALVIVAMILSLRTVDDAFRSCLAALALTFCRA